jgi:hypothetical protein
VRDLAADSVHTRQQYVGVLKTPSFRFSMLSATGRSTWPGPGSTGAAELHARGLPTLSLPPLLTNRVRRTAGFGHRQAGSDQMPSDEAVFVDVDLVRTNAAPRNPSAYEPRADVTERPWANWLFCALSESVRELNRDHRKRFARVRAVLGWEQVDLPCGSAELSGWNDRAAAARTARRSFRFVHGASLVSAVPAPHYTNTPKAPRFNHQHAAVPPDACGAARRRSSSSPLRRTCAVCGPGSVSARRRSPKRPVSTFAGSKTWRWRRSTSASRRSSGSRRLSKSSLHGFCAGQPCRSGGQADRALSRLAPTDRGSFGQTDRSVPPDVYVGCACLRRMGGGCVKASA